MICCFFPSKVDLIGRVAFVGRPICTEQCEGHHSNGRKMKDVIPTAQEKVTDSTARTAALYRTVGSTSLQLHHENARDKDATRKNMYSPSCHGSKVDV